MRKIFFILFVGAMFVSCNHSIYSTQVLQDNYNSRMSSKKEQVIKQQIKIFMADDKIGQAYEVLYVNTYKPFSIPILRGYKKQMTAKFLQRAATKAADLNGDAIIIEAVGNYKVIKLK